MEKKIYHYRVYGINLDSEIEIPEFQVNEDYINGAKVNLTLGVAPKEVKEEVKNGRKMSSSKDMVWFHIDGVATYIISQGESVLVEPCENYDRKLLKVYIMGSVMGFLLLQQQVLAIHGGTTVMGDGAVIFTGDRGAGKSTLTMGLVHKGYKFLADDVAAIRVNHIPKVTPGFPYHKLCEDIIETMNYPKEGLTFFRGDGKVKYLVPDHKQFCPKEIPLKALIKISQGDVEEVSFEQVYGQDKFHMILNNIYRNEYINSLGGVNPKYFKQCMEVAKSIKCYNMVRPRNKYTIQEQIKLIEEVLLGDKARK